MPAQRRHQFLAGLNPQFIGQFQPRASSKIAVVEPDQVGAVAVGDKSGLQRRTDILVRATQGNLDAARKAAFGFGKCHDFLHSYAKAAGKIVAAHTALDNNNFVLV